MGSRAIVVVCRDADVARRRFGVETSETGAVYTRTGRPFLDDPPDTEAVISRVRAAVEAARLERCADSAEATRRLTAIPGIGPWTAAEVVRTAYGDPDAVSVGDYHIPHTVAWALAREVRGSDARMLELLEPFRGHRGRVCDLLAHGGIGAPKFGPRMPIRSFARF